MPANVVLFNTLGDTFRYLDGASIAHCLYGAEKHHIDLQLGENNKLEDYSSVRLGGGRVATSTLSAVATLHETRKTEQLSLKMFHNRDARNPIDPNDLHLPDIEHFAYRTHGDANVPGE